MKIDTYKCDVCGTVKGENNHWFRIDSGATGLELSPWGAAQASATSVDLCSEACVIKVVGKWLANPPAVDGAKQLEARLAGVVSINGARAV